MPVISWYKRPVRRARARLVALACACALASACAPEACSDREERRLERAVELLIGEPGPTADAAERALIDSGSAAIQYLETGLYDATPRARRRIVKALVGIGDPTAVPILLHLERRDPDPDVRAAAAAGRAALTSTVETAASP